MSLLDVTTVDNDVLGLQSYLKSWLHDCGTDSEHIHLSLPAPSADITGSGRLVIKCDLYDRMLPVNALPPAVGRNFVSRERKLWRGVDRHLRVRPVFLSTLVSQRAWVNFSTMHSNNAAFTLSKMRWCTIANCIFGESVKLLPPMKVSQFLIKIGNIFEGFKFCEYWLSRTGLTC